jgi:hypothetical protein
VWQVNENLNSMIAEDNRINEVYDSLNDRFANLETMLVKANKQNEALKRSNQELRYSNDYQNPTIDFSRFFVLDCTSRYG